MSDVVKHSVLSRKEIENRVNRIALSLSGKGGDASARNHFLSVFVQVLMSEIFKGFIIKSQGRTDECGERWRPLAQSTIRRKARTMDQGLVQQLSQVRPSSNTTTTQQEAGYFAQLLRSGMSNADAKAKARALHLRANTKSTGIGRIPIGIATGELGISVSPGRVVNNRYYPPPGQLYENQDNTINITLEPDHAAPFHAKRRIWPIPTRMRVWTNRALAAAARSTAEYIAARM